MRRYFIHFLLVFFGSLLSSALATAVVAFGYLRDVSAADKAGPVFLAGILLPSLIVFLNFLMARGYRIGIQLLRIGLLAVLAILAFALLLDMPPVLAVVGLLFALIGLGVSWSARYLEMVEYFAFVRQTHRSPEAADRFMEKELIKR